MVRPALLFLLALSLSAGELHDAVRKRDVAAVQQALRKGADVHPLDKTGYTALHWAGHNADIVRLLLKAGANPRALNKFGQTALHTAHDLEAVKALKVAGVPIDKPDTHGSTPLAVQAASNKPEILAYLIALRPRIDGYGRVVPLINAARSSRLENIAQLLSAGADIHARDPSGRTALHVAGSADAVKALLAAGANAKATDKQGQTPRQTYEGELAAAKRREREKDIARAEAKLAALKSAPVGKPIKVVRPAPTPKPTPQPQPVIPEEYRTWTDSSGKTVRARLVSVDGAGLVLQRQNGHQIKMHLDRLSEADRQWLRRHGAGKAVSLTPASIQNWVVLKGNPGFPDKMAPVNLGKRGRALFLDGQDDHAFDLKRTLDDPRQSGAVALRFRPSELFPRSGSVAIALIDSSSNRELKCFFPAGHYQGALTLSQDGKVLRTQKQDVSYPINKTHIIRMSYRGGTLKASLNGKAVYAESKIDLAKFDTLLVRFNQMTAVLEELSLAP